MALVSVNDGHIGNTMRNIPQPLLLLSVRMHAYVENIELFRSNALPMIVYV